MMSSRPLRTTAPARPRTFAERIRYARISANLSQPQFAKQLALITRTKINKSLVSQWELGKVANPNNETLYAIQAVTGFSAEWLVRGRGPEHVADPKAEPLNIDLLARAMAAAMPELGDTAGAKAKRVAALYELLADTPNIDPALLTRIADTLSKG